VILLVRHAVALRRHEWDGPDRYRPLSPRGREQARAICDALFGYSPPAIVSSPATRCVETVDPLAKASGVEVNVVEDLFEGHGTDALDLVRGLHDAEGGIVVCSHGDVLRELLLAFTTHLRDDVPPDPPFAKGAAWIVEDASARYAAPPA